MSTKKALVLGASGMVGRPLVNALHLDGWQVYGAARFRSLETIASSFPPGCLPIKFDVTTDDPKILPDVEAVFLEIWDPSLPEQLWVINFYGVGRVVERYSGVADIINGSTINVYGDQPAAPDETSPCRPTSEYGLSRFVQEKLIDYFSMRGGKKGIHVRYAHANSASQGMIISMAEKILEEKSQGPNPDSRVQVLSLEDFVRVTMGAINYVECPPIAVNCCHPQDWSRRELAEAIYQKLERGKVIFDQPTGGSEHSVYANAGRMLAWFGEPRISLEILINRVVESITK